MKPWDWTRFEGSASALKYNRRDLPSLESVMARVYGRTAVVQAGGNLGIFAKRLAQEFAAVYCFEPAADLFAVMQRNAPEPNILRFQAALGCRRELVGVSRVRRDGKGDPHEGITHVSGPGVIPTLRIDDLGLPICDLIYLDLEGYEYFALQGAADTIRRCRPVISVELNKHVAEMGLDADTVRQWLDGFGYRFVEKLHADEVYVPMERAA